MKTVNSNHLLKSIEGILRFLIFMIMISAFTGCMMMGMHKLGRSATSEDAKPVQSESKLIDLLILRSINDLSGKPELSIESLAVWKIETKSPSVDTENIRQKIITSLVNNTSYKVISREHLDELLAEQSLSLSGTIDSSSATDIGELIGVEGFVIGYISKKKELIELSLSLIKTSSGEIVWSNLQQENIKFH